jgi:hypothetical protein
MMDLTGVAMEESAIRWRFVDPRYRVVSAGDLGRIEALDGGSARWLLEVTRPWYREQPFTHGWFADVVSTSIDTNDAEDVRRVRKWLYRCGVPFGRRVLLSWDEREAARTTWKMVVKHWDVMWWPSDDLVVFDESLSWGVFFWHEGEVFLARRVVEG